NRFDRSMRGRLIRSYHHGFYLYNARGDVVQRTNAQGSILMTYRYSAFGMYIGTTSQGGVGSTNPFRWGGMYYDFHRSEYMTPARQFNPRLGRWTQPDPFWGIHNMQDCIHSILQAGNLFVAMGNDPVNRIDPSGLAYFFIHCDDFVREAIWNANQITSGRPIYMHNITSAADFISLWNNVIYNYADPIHGIFVFSHGTASGLWFSGTDRGIFMDGRNRANTADAHSVAELNILHLHGAVHLFACNAGHLDFYFRSYAVSGRTGGNIAAALSTRVTGWGAVRAWDSPVSFGPPLIWLVTDRFGHAPRISSPWSLDGFYTIRNRYGQLGAYSRRSPRGVQQWRDGQLNNLFVPFPTYFR
ncbi:MAG: hypothetical protein FWC32_00195, partial [Firmicutes bacterium]|nr:hypothetical protein [Bacillota bacterium]